MILYLTDEEHDGAFHCFRFNTHDSKVSIGLGYCNTRLEQVVLQYTSVLGGECCALDTIELVIDSDQVTQVLHVPLFEQFEYSGEWTGVVTLDMFCGHSAKLLKTTKFAPLIIEFVNQLRAALPKLTLQDPNQSNLRFQETHASLMKVFKVQNHV